MRVRVTVRLLAVAAALALGCGCRHAPARSIVGAWTCDCQRGGAFQFRPDGSATWVVGTGDGAETYEIRYLYDPAPEPDHLDLFGFDRGALAELRLYGILEFVDAETFRLDVEPGSLDPRSPAPRPRTFTAQTVLYHRQ